MTLAIITGHPDRYSPSGSMALVGQNQGICLALYSNNNHYINTDMALNLSSGPDITMDPGCSIGLLDQHDPYWGTSLRH